MKSDLNAILPQKLNELLCFKQTDASMSYEAFKTFVETQTSTLLMNSHRLPVNSVDGPQCSVVPANYEEQGEEETIEAYDGDGNFIGAFTKTPGKRFPRPQRTGNRARPQPERAAGTREPKCSNCGEAHNTRECK